MYKSFKFVLFNKSFPNLAKFQIRPNFGRSRISAGFVKKAGFWPEPNSGTALSDRKHIYNTGRLENRTRSVSNEKIGRYFLNAELRLVNRN